jgi:ribonuclease HI
LKKVQLITDGACIGNPGPGGWACILRYGDRKKEMFGSERQTTNNRMELTAAVKGLAALREPCEVEIVTDSQYMKNGIQKWIANWKRNGWRTAEKKAVLNQDLWEELDRQNARHKTIWSWTKGHASHADNNRCDELATAAAREQTSSS